MGKNLVIVESPAKAKTINKYLGPDYIVRSSIGHIRDLPTGANKVKAEKRASTRGLSPEEKDKIYKERKAEDLVRNMGIDPFNDWKAVYEILPGKEKTLAELKKYAKTSDTIYLATDLDREGEAIAWHLQESIGEPIEKYKRVTFTEITKKAIREAFSKPGDLDMDRVDAQQARRFLDRLVGFMLSPLLWKKIARGLSAGRVQSVATKLVVEREKEIGIFIPEEYWELHADLLGEQASKKFQAAVSKKDGKKYRPNSKADSDEAVNFLKTAEYKVLDRKDKPTKSKPWAPFTTSTLQQAASVTLGFNVKQTMMAAQKLYEAGFITYMRTDSTNLSADSVAACRSYVENNYGAKYLPQDPKIYSSKKNAQEAHEAIRPSDVEVDPSAVAGVDAYAVKLYKLIRDRFIACQMEDALFDSTSIVISAGNYELRSNGRVMRFDGWQKVIPQKAKKDEDKTLPNLTVGEILPLEKLLPTQHFTKPPARYSEASLVKELEKKGIGRPSTYAAIISTIQDRGYARIEQKRFYAEKMGEIVTDSLDGSFTDLMNYGFTANMEEKLDNIAEGSHQWKALLNDFFKDLSKKLEIAEVNMPGNEPTATDIECPNCKRKMAIRTGSTGVFLGCTGYSLPKDDKCTKTLPLASTDEVVNTENDEEQEAKALMSKKRCKLCNSVMVAYLVDETRKLHVCGNNPKCSGSEVELGKYKIKGYEGPIIECDRCGSNMELKNGRFGKYFACTKYPECKNTRKLLKNGDVAPPKADPIPMPELKCEKSDAHFVLRDGASGMFLAANNYPKSRETRNPLISEIRPHGDKLDPKYKFLLEAPDKDKDGNSFIVSFSRKTKEQYIKTQNEKGKMLVSAYYANSKWDIKE